MPEWNLIIGHGKTGSTFLQKSLVLSRNRLSDSGISYPAGQNEITSGNGVNLFNPGLPEIDGGRVLFCNEHMWRRMLAHNDLVDALQKMGTPRILLMIRDPIEHAISLWQQNVKMGRRSAEEIHVEFEKYDLPRRIKNLIQKIDNSDADLTIFNYSKISKKLLPSVSAWLGGVKLVQPENKRINRSLTRSELVVASELNRNGYETGNIMREFVSSLPDIKGRPAAPPVHVQEEMLNRLHNDLCFINNRAKDQGYSLKTLPSAESGTLNLTPEHFSIIFENLQRKRRFNLRGSINLALRNLLRAKVSQK